MEKISWTEKFGITNEEVLEKVLRSTLFFIPQGLS